VDSLNDNCAAENDHSVYTTYQRKLVIIGRQTRSQRIYRTLRKQTCSAESGLIAAQLLFRRISELLPADARFVHQATLGNRKHGPALVVFADRSRVVFTITDTG
jgi:hypothetical protein